MNPTRSQRSAPTGRALARAGFTLIELVITMLIIAIVAAIAVPRYGMAQQQYRVQTGADRVLADLTRAVALAKASSAGVQMQFKNGNPVYDVIAAAPGARGSWSTDLSAPPYGVWVASAIFGTDMTCAISGRGTATAGSILLRSESLGTTITIDTDGTGHAAAPSALTRQSRVVAVESAQ